MSKHFAMNSNHLAGKQEMLDTGFGFLKGNHFSHQGKMVSPGNSVVLKIRNTQSDGGESCHNSVVKRIGKGEYHA